MTVETVWTKELSTVEFNLLCFLAHPFPSSPPLQKPPILFFQGWGLAEILNPNHPDSSFSFLFSHTLKLRRVALIPTSTSHFWFEAGVKSLQQVKASVPSSLASFLELNPWRAGDSVNFQEQMPREAEPLLRLHLCPLRPLFFQFSTSFWSAAGHVCHSTGPLK